MTTHYNTTIAEDAARILNTKSSDTLPSTMNILTPVIPITRYCNIVRRQEAINVLTATIYTTPTDKDFYLTAATLSFIKDATSTSLSSTIRVVIEGITWQILSLAQLTLTAQSGNQSISFPFPIKIDRGTNITVQNNTNVANVATYGTIMGYTVETTKGV